MAGVAHDGGSSAVEVRALAEVADAHSLSEAQAAHMHRCRLCVRATPGYHSFLAHGNHVKTSQNAWSRRPTGCRANHLFHHALPPS